MILRLMMLPFLSSSFCHPFSCHVFHPPILMTSQTFVVIRENSRLEIA